MPLIRDAKLCKRDLVWWVHSVGVEALEMRVDRERETFLFFRISWILGSSKPIFENWVASWSGSIFFSFLFFVLFGGERQTDGQIGK